DVKQEDVLTVTSQYGALNGGTCGHGFVGVDVFAGFGTKELLDLFLYLGHARHATSQDDVVNVGHLDACIGTGRAARLKRALDEIFNQCLQLGAGDLQVQVLGPGGIGRDVGQVDFGLLRGRQLDLGFFCRLAQALQCQDVGRQVGAAFLAELVNDVFDEGLVEVFTTQEGVPVGGQHFELLFTVDLGDFNDGDVERAAAQVIDGNLAITLFCLVHAKGQGCRRGLVDDALDFKAGNATGILGGLALAVVEVGRHGNDGFGHFFAKVVFGG